MFTRTLCPQHLVQASHFSAVHSCSSRGLDVAFPQQRHHDAPAEHRLPPHVFPFSLGQHTLLFVSARSITLSQTHNSAFLLTQGRKRHHRRDTQLGNNNESHSIINITRRRDYLPQLNQPLF